MRSNAISKFSREDHNNFNKTLYTHKIQVYAKPTKMTLDIKTVDSTANVINKVESSNINLYWVHILLIIIVVIMCTTFFYKIYNMHNKCLRKRYMSQGNDLDKI